MTAVGDRFIRTVDDIRAYCYLDKEAAAMHFTDVVSSSLFSLAQFSYWVNHKASSDAVGRKECPHDCPIHSYLFDSCRISGEDKPPATGDNIFNVTGAEVMVYCGNKYEYFARVPLPRWAELVIRAVDHRESENRTVTAGELANVVVMVRAKLRSESGAE